MDESIGVEREAVGVFQSDEGVGAAGAVQEVPTDTSTPPSPEPTRAGLSAEEIAKIPPELRPRADGTYPAITPKLLKAMRGKYFTVKHVLLTNCGHKIDMINQPRNNCENCWFQWFNTHPQLVETADQFFRTHGKGPLVGMRGVKFFKMFVRYMATVIHFMKEEAAAKEAQEKNELNREDQLSTVNPNPESQSGETDRSASVIEG